MKIVQPSVTCLSSTPEATSLIELAGRVSRKSEYRITPTSYNNFIVTLLKAGHESVIEHASATFRIITDRGISHQIVRHRIASYTQESSIHSIGEEISVIEPLGLSCEQKDKWILSMRRIEKEFFLMLSDGIPLETARSILPTCLKTEIIMTANFREWRHFIRLRTAKAAHPQIREVAGMILQWFKTNYPVIVEDIIEENKESK